MTDENRYRNTSLPGNYSRSSYSSLQGAVPPYPTNSTLGVQHPGSTGQGVQMYSAPASNSVDPTLSHAFPGYSPGYNNFSVPGAQDPGAQYAGGQAYYQPFDVSMQHFVPTEVPPGASTYNLPPGAVPTHRPAAPRQRNRELKQCSNCSTESTPMWRREPVTHRLLCNACGIHQQQQHQPRPVRASIELPSPGTAEAQNYSASDGRQCSNCGTQVTTTWRRNNNGDQVCNACGVYERLHGSPRPAEMRRDTIAQRARHSQV